ncbi:MAG: DciA family protein [Mariprofundales bacterium]|nr:DciA family protein [Mariprofundales bacterium]
MRRKGELDRSVMPQSVATHFAELLGGKRIALLRDEARIKRRWLQIVGPMLAARSCPLELELLADGSCCLWVAVDHPYLAQQLRLMRDELRRSCYRHCGVRRIAKIRSRIDPAVSGYTVAEPERGSERPVSWQMCRAAAAEMRAVTNRTLRHSMVRARLQQMVSSSEESE